MPSVVDIIRNLTGDTRSDGALIFEWGNRAIDERRDDVLAAFPEDRDRFYAMRRSLRDGPIDTFVERLKSGFTDQLPKLATDLGEMALRGANATLPDVDIGSMQESKNLLDQGADWMARQSAEQAAESERKRDPFAVRSFKEAETPSDYLNLGASMTGENLPQLAASILPGAWAGRAAKIAQLGLGATEAAAASAGLRAAASAAYVSSAIQNTADIYGGLDEEAKSSGKGLLTSLGGGAVAGALDVLGESLPLARMFPGLDKKFFTPVISNVLERGGVMGAFSNAIATGSMEAVTEALQEGVAIASEEYAQGITIPDDVIADRMKSAAFGGGILGFGLGGMTGYRKPAEENLRPEMAGDKPGSDDAAPAAGSVPTPPTPPSRPPVQTTLPLTVTPGVAQVPPGQNFEIPFEQPFNPDAPLQPVARPGAVGIDVPAAPAPVLDGTQTKLPLTVTPAVRQVRRGQNYEFGFDQPYDIDAPSTVAVKTVAEGLDLPTPTVVNPNTINSVAARVEAKSKIADLKPKVAPKTTAQTKPAAPVPPAEPPAAPAPAPAAPKADTTKVRIATFPEVIDFLGLADAIADPENPVNVINGVLELPAETALRHVKAARAMLEQFPDTDKATANMVLKWADAAEKQANDLIKGRAATAPTGTVAKPTAAPTQTVSVKMDPHLIKLLKMHLPLDPATFENGQIPQFMIDAHAKLNAEGVLDIPVEIAPHFQEQVESILKRTVVSKKTKETASQFLNDLKQQLALITKPKADEPVVVGNIGGQPIVIPPKSGKPKKPVVAEPIIGKMRWVKKDGPSPTKNNPVYGYLFDEKDGNTDDRIRKAAGGSTGKGKDASSLVRRAVILLDRATNHVYVRKIWSDGAESTAPGRGIRIDLSQRKKTASDPDFKKGERTVDFNNPDEAAGWDNISSQMHRGQPRIEVLGYLHFAENDRSNFNVAGVKELMDNPYFDKAIKAFYQQPEGLSPEDLAKYLEEKARRDELLGKGAGKKKNTSSTETMTGKEKLTEASGEQDPREALEEEEKELPPPDKLKALAAAFLKRMNEPKASIGQEDIRKLWESMAAVMKFDSDSARKQHVEYMMEYTRSAKKLREVLKKVVDGTTNATIQMPGSYLASSPEALAIFSHGLGTLQRHGINVILAAQKFMDAMGEETNTRGVHIPLSNGQVIIGLVADYLTGNIKMEEVVRLYHEGAHPFIDKLPIWQQQAFQNAISNLPWEKQAWISLGTGMDARVIANTPADQLMPHQQLMLSRMTPEELRVLRGTSPSTLVLERAVEHLAALGIEGYHARDILSQIIRFVKGIMLRIAVETQRFMKGEENVSENLARAFVENKWLQFINGDFAASPGAIAQNFGQFIGRPMTDVERVAVYENINGEAQNFYYTPGTGYRETIPASTDTVAGLLAQHNILAQEKNLGQMIQLMKTGSAIPQDALQYLTGGVAFEQLTLDSQMQVLAQAKKELDGIQPKKNKQGQLLAPNGQVSQLNELQWKIVRTSYFKRWFGDWETDPANSSKVITPETGEPRVVYHGTGAQDNFTVFQFFNDLGHHFGDPSEANNRIGYDRIPLRPGEVPETYKFEKGKLYWNPPGSRDRIIPAFLNIRNPAPLEDNDWVMNSHLVGMVQRQVLKQDQAEDIFMHEDRHEHANNVRAALEENKFDGAVYENKVEGDMGSVQTWIAFNANQVKDTTSRTFTPSPRMNRTEVIGASVDPTIAANTDFATINHVSGVIAGIMQDPEIRRTLPGKFVKDGQPTFEHLVFGMSETDTTEKRTAALEQKLSTMKDMRTGKALEFEPGMQINQLPITEDGSSAQQRAMRDSLIQLQKIENNVLKKRERLVTIWQELNDIAANKKRPLTKPEQAELDRLNFDIPVFNNVLKLPNIGITAQIDRLRGKLRTGFIFEVAAGSKYYVPETPTDTAQQVYAKVKAVPADMYFQKGMSEELARDVVKMRKWLDNEDNMKNGDVYETVETQWRKLAEVTLNPAYTARRARLKKSAFDSMANMFRALGTPSGLYLFSRFQALDSVIARYTADMEVMGSKWSSLYDKIKETMGAAMPDVEFRRKVYNPIILLAIATPDGTVDRWNKIVDAFNVTRPKGYKIEGADAESVKNLLRFTLETEKKQVEMFEALGHQVQDKDLGVGPDGRQRQRSLIRHGVITGRLAVSKFFESVWQDMKPLWTNTAPVITTNPDGSENKEINPLYNATELWKIGKEAFTKGIDQYFSPQTKLNFVEPLIYHNIQHFLSPSSIASATKLYSSQANVRAAWESSGGDIAEFISTLNRLEGGDSATEAEFASMVMKTFTGMFTKMNNVANEREQAQESSGIPVIPQEIMNARTAEDFPPEWIDASLYDQGSNKVVLHSLALNHAFGRAGLTSGDFKQNLSTAKDEMDRLWRQYQYLKNNEKKTPAQMKAIMGEQQYGIAVDALDHMAMISNLQKKMAFLVDPLSSQSGDLRVMDEILGMMAGLTIQSPRSALQNTLDVLGVFYRMKFSTPALASLKDSVKFGLSDAAAGIMQWFGQNVHFMADFAKRNRDLGAKDPDNYRSWRDAMTDFGTNNNLAPKGDEGPFSKFNPFRLTTLRRVKALINASPLDLLKETVNKAMKEDRYLPNVPGDKALAPKARVLGIFKSVSMYLSNGIVFGQYNAYKDLVMRGIQYINKSSDPSAYAQRLVNGEIKLAPNELGYTRKWMIMNDTAAFEYMSDAVATKMGQGSLERMIGDAWQRTQRNANEPIITNDQFARIRSVALNDVQLASTTSTTPVDIRSNSFFRMFSIFLAWPWNAMTRFPAMFQTAQGQYTFKAAMDGAITTMWGVIPLTLAASLGMDWYDEELLGKKQNIRDVGAESLVPVLGPIAHPMATMERLARYGTGGFASEWMNGIINMDDTRGAVSADSRVFILSQIHNLIRIGGNIFQTGTFDYQHVWRPFIQFMGGNGLLQYAQIANKASGMTNNEAAINERINIGNYLRAVGRDLDLSVIPTMQSGQGIPNEVTPHVAQMELAAYNDDFATFEDAFHNAVQAYREIHPKDDDPADGVIRSFQARHPLRRVFRTNPTQGEYHEILENLNDNGREAVSSGVRLFNKYLLKLGASPFEGKVEKETAAGKQQNKYMSTQQIVRAQLEAANASYSSSFLD